MIIGSGMLARAFLPLAANNSTMCIYAYGVSYSNCKDPDEFLRESTALAKAIEQYRHINFIYFGTCSVEDPEMCNSPYVTHKLRMENMVMAHGRGIVFRLPQVAGRTRNRLTLLSFLSEHLISGKPVDLWMNARRNIIDVEDVVLIVKWLLNNRNYHNSVINIANPFSYSMVDIVTTMENVIGLKGVYRTISKGSAYPIDISAIYQCIKATGISFEDDYLENVIYRYYFNQRKNVATHC